MFKFSDITSKNVIYLLFSISNFIKKLYILPLSYISWKFFIDG